MPKIFLFAVFFLQFLLPLTNSYACGLAFKDSGLSVEDSFDYSPEELAQVSIRGVRADALVESLQNALNDVDFFSDLEKTMLEDLRYINLNLAFIARSFLHSFVFAQKKDFEKSYLKKRRYLMTRVWRKHFGTDTPADRTLLDLLNDRLDPHLHSYHDIIRLRCTEFVRSELSMSEIDDAINLDLERVAKKLEKGSVLEIRSQHIKRAKRRLVNGAGSKSLYLASILAETIEFLTIKQDAAYVNVIDLAPDSKMHLGVLESRLRRTLSQYPIEYTDLLFRALKHVMDIEVLENRLKNTSFQSELQAAAKRAVETEIKFYRKSQTEIEVNSELNSQSAWVRTPIAEKGEMPAPRKTKKDRNEIVSGEAKQNLGLTQNETQFDGQMWSDDEVLDYLATIAVSEASVDELNNWYEQNRDLNTWKILGRTSQQLLSSERKHAIPGLKVTTSAGVYQLSMPTSDRVYFGIGQGGVKFLGIATAIKSSNGMAQTRAVKSMEKRWR